MPVLSAAETGTTGNNLERTIPTDTNSQAANRLTRRIYENIVKVSTVIGSSTELTSWEENFREDGESGAFYDVRIFEQLLNVNQVIQQLHVLCWPPLQCAE